MENQRNLHKLIHNPQTYQEIVDDMWPRMSESELIMTWHLQEITRQNVSNILQSEWHVKNELESYGLSDELYNYFIQHPSAWYELKRKLHAYKKISDDGRYIIPKDKEEYILSVFLRRWWEIINHQIEELWRKILKDQHLLSRIATEPSIMDSSHGQIKWLQVQWKNQRKDFIEKTLKIGYISNVDIKDEVEIEKNILKLLPIFQEYIFQIFNISIEVPKSKKTFNAIIEWFVQELWPDQWVKSKHIWMLIKSMRAWWSYDYIQEQHKKAEQYIHSIPNILREQGFDFKESMLKKEGSYDGNIDIHTWIIHLSDTEIIQIEYRTKSIRSVLLKLWESEDYNNYDALRDTLGMVIIFPDLMDEDVKLSIIWRMSSIMNHKWYMLKNKWLIEHKKNIKNIIPPDHEPLGTVVEWRKWKSSEKLKNLSFSGFTHIQESHVGIEIQFYNQNGYDFWKSDHLTFDVLKVVSAWARWGWFITPRQMLDVVRKNIPRNILEAKLKKRPQEIIYGYIQSGALIPYIWKNNALYLVPKQYEYLFFWKFTHSIKMDKNDSYIRDFISSIVSPTTL